MNRIETMSPVAYHDVIYMEADIRPTNVKSKPRKIILYRRANWDKIEDEMMDHEFQYMDNSDKSVDDIWTMFKNKLLECVEHIPTRMTNGRNHLPFVTRELQYMMKKGTDNPEEQ